MSESDQYDMMEPELQLYNENKDESYSLPSFSSIVVRNHQHASGVVSKTSSMGDDTTSTVGASTDDSSVSSIDGPPAVKVVDRCYQQFKESDSYEVEYSLTEYESKLYLEDMKGRLDEPIIEELEGDSGDEFDEDDDDSILSLNSLEKIEFDDFYTQNCKSAPKMVGCLGLVHMGLCGGNDDEAVDEFYASDLRRSNTEQSSIYDVQQEEPRAAEPSGEKFVINEIRFTKDGTSSNNTNNNTTTKVVTGVDLTTQDEPVVLSGRYTYDDDCDDRDELERLVVLETESSDEWDEDEESKDSSVYLGGASVQLADDESYASLILTTELNFEDEEENYAMPINLEPDGIKMRSDENGIAEIIGNGTRNTGDFEVLHLEPRCDSLEA
ncbi:MAG: hypothetical protein SGBAC_011298 [Bacillariaceae sp.]